MSSPINWQRFAEIIGEAKRILLTAHVRPDGDCIGSEIAMYLALRSLGKEVRIVNAQETPLPLSCVGSTHAIRALPELTEEERQWVESVDLIFVLDTSSWAQLDVMGPVLQASKAKKIVVDHHVKGDEIGAEKFVDTNAEAAGSLVVAAIDALGVTWTPEMAHAAFIALATDTGWFRFSSVTAETFRTAAMLVEHGAKPDAVYRELYEQESLGRLRLIGRTLTKIESHCDGQVMLTWITLDDLAQAGAVPSDTEDIVNMALQIKGTQFAVLFYELRSGGYKVSFRSRCDIDCSELAAKFGGGGHKKAAGATLHLPFEQVRQAVLEAVVGAMKNGS